MLKFTPQKIYTTMNNIICKLDFIVVLQRLAHLLDYKNYTVEKSYSQILKT